MSSLKQMFCLRPSNEIAAQDHNLHKIKQLSNYWPENGPDSSRQSSYYSDEPASPRVGCMGHIKRNNNNNNNNRVFMISATTNNNNNKSHHHRADHKYMKLRKMLSGKNLMMSNHYNHINSSSNSSRRGIIIDDDHMGRKERKSNIQDDLISYVVRSVVVDVDLDPPLPVKIIKQRSSSTDHEVLSLWRRRCGGEGLKGLQLRRHFGQPPNL